MIPLSTNTKLWIARLLSEATLMARRAIGANSIARVTRRGVKWELRLTEGIDIALFWGMYEVSTARAIARILSKGMVAFDIGANIGVHTLPMAARVGRGGRVFAFEPTTYAFHRLRDNILLNPNLGPRIEAYQVFLAENSFAAVAQALPSSWPLFDRIGIHPIHGGRSMPTDGASATSLDQFVKEKDLKRLDLIKLDCDGNELHVLKGAEKTILQFRPVLVMEFVPYLHLERGPNGLTELLELLQSYGYAAETKKAGTSVRLIADEIEAMCPKRGGVDLILRAN